MMVTKGYLAVGVVGVLLLAVAAVKVGDECSEHADCNHGPNSLRHSKCEVNATGSGQCECVGGYIDLTGDACIKANIGDSCEDLPEDFCETGVPNSLCNENNECSCKPKFYPQQVEYGRTLCKPVLPGAPCDTSVNISCASKVKGGLECCSKNNDCMCKEGYVFALSKMSCFKESSSKACSKCYQTSGKCYDSDEDGTGDGCECPDNRETSDPSDIMATGCDVGKAELGDFCDYEGKSVICYRENSYCVHAGDLSTNYFCACKPGYVALPVPGGGGDHECVKQISRMTDLNCEECEGHGGKCYDNDFDGLRDGCVCPMSKSSSDPDDPDKDCDQSHLTVSCMGYSMTVCYIPYNTTDGNGVNGEDLEQGDSLLYIDSRLGQDPCIFQETTDKWCLTLSLKNNRYKACNTRVIYPSENEVSYENWVILQKNKWNKGSDDTSFHVYCTFNTKVHTKSGGSGIIGRSKMTSEGETVKPDLKFDIEDEFGRDATSMGVKLGRPTKLIVKMVDPQDTYVAMTAETCVASSEPQLSNPMGKSVLLLYNGCPTSDGYIKSDSNFQTDSQNDHMLKSGLFPIFKFEGSEYIYFHCSIKVCRNKKECSPTSCDKRRKRAASDGMPATPAVLRESLHSSAVRIWSDEDAQADKELLIAKDDERGVTLSKEVIAMFGAGLFAVLAIVVALSVAAIAMQRRSRTLPISSPPRPEQVPRSSDC